MATLDIVQDRLTECDNKIRNLHSKMGGEDGEYPLTDEQYEKITHKFLAIRRELSVIKDILEALQEGGQKGAHYVNK